MAMSSTLRLRVIFSRYVDDPYIDEVLEREPLTDEVEVIVVGGGFGGYSLGPALPRPVSDAFV